MRKISAIGCIAMAMAVFCAGTQVLGNDVPRMLKEELKSLLGTPELILLDVRTARDWKKADAKIKDALREDPNDVSSWSLRYPKEKTIVLYCG